MKANIHPPTIGCTGQLPSCGKTWTRDREEGIRVDICSNCHPFFTGEAQRILDIEGRSTVSTEAVCPADICEGKKAREAAKKSQSAH